MGTISGKIWDDINNDGVKNADEQNFSEVSVYLDINNDQTLNDDEPSVITDSRGQYEFSDLSSGLYTVRTILPTGIERVFPNQDTPSIPFNGLEENNQGIAAWNWNISHTLPYPYETQTYYYLASRDYVDSTSDGGIQGTGEIVGFPNLTTALADNGYTVSDLTVQFGRASLGDDIEGQDWFFEGDTETRIYRTGDIRFQLNGEDLVGTAFPDLTLQIDYNDPFGWFSFADDRISGWTDSLMPENQSTDSSPGVQEVAQALLTDIGDREIRFVFDSFQPAAQQDLVVDGVFGALFEAQFGQIELASDFSIRDGAYQVILDADETIADLNFNLEGGNSYALAYTSQSFTVNGDYIPVTGDFDGSGTTDILWYKPGAGADYIWSFNADGTYDSEPFTVNGNYDPITGDFDGSGTADILWYKPGTDADYIWSFNADGTYNSEPFTVNGEYEPIEGDFNGNGIDDILWYKPGTGADYIWSFNSDGTYESSPFTVNGVYEPISGDFDGNNSTDILWYQAGTSSDYIWSFGT